MTDALETLILLPFAILTLNIDTPVDLVTDMSYVRSGRLWLTDHFNDEVIQVDTDGIIKDKVSSMGPFCVTEDDALLYSSNAFEDDEDDEDGENVLCIKKKTSLKTVTLLKTEKNEKAIGIHSSFINGHILVLIGNVTEGISDYICLFKITRYSENGVKIQDIKVDDMDGEKRHYYCCASITENRNRDIIISSNVLKEVVGMDSSGGRRFTYSNPTDLTPRDICTDKYGHILVAYESCIHLLDEDGTFKKILLRNLSRSDFFSLSLDDKQNLYVGSNCSIVKVYKYLKDR